MHAYTITVTKWFCKLTNGIEAMVAAAAVSVVVLTVDTAVIALVTTVMTAEVTD